MRPIGRVGRLPSMFHGGGDGRTYSGVWPGGQAARKPVFWAVPSLHRARGMDRRQRNLKPHDLSFNRGYFRHGFNIETIGQEARGAQIIESARVDHARRWFCRAAMRGEGSVHDGGEGHDR